MSVRKRTRRTRKGEEYEIWLADYTDAGGVRRQKSFKRKGDAVRWHESARVDVRAGVHVADSATITVREAARLWISSCEGRQLERTTVEAYEQHIQLHILPAMGTTRLSAITPPMVRAFEDAMRAGSAPFDKPRSPAMIKRIVRSLGSMLSDAQERGLLAKNVVRDVRARRHAGIERQAEARQRGKIKVGVDVPTRDEIRAILTAAKGRWRPLLMTAIFAGLRSSELRGLHWGDVDLSRGEIHVRQRADRYKSIGAPKTVAGERVVPIPRALVNVLREWKVACPPGDLVFPTGKGTIELHQNIVNRGLKPVCVAAGVVTKEGRAKYTGLHSLRHFCASWMINRKEDGGLALPAKIVQERLGHSNISVTLDTYGHLFPQHDHADELAAAADLILGKGE
ncbi:site-specific integrase [Methylocystis sp. ATCC 49242]|uniref:tyrosine-type recombinase/integrase n=1 Tax=Methylocystis sp. ATCC 49242 TaxID=622637 RepID=UPI0001F86CC5|nr:site-specific integrase [Methylocystis sp. ATCC 49242]